MARAPVGKTPGSCPDCGEQTPVLRTRYLGESQERSWVVGHELLERLYDSLGSCLVEDAGKQVRSKNPASGQIEIRSTAKTFFVCAECRADTKTLNWVELDETTFIGPLCSEHLKDALERYAEGAKGRTRDVSIYTMRAADKDLKAIALERKEKLTQRVDLTTQIKDPFTQF